MTEEELCHPLTLEDLSKNLLNPSKRFNLHQVLSLICEEITTLKNEQLKNTCSINTLFDRVAF